VGFRKSQEPARAAAGGRERINPIVLEIAIGQASLTRLADGRRDEGTAKTTTHRAKIASPMNSNTNASTAKSPNKTIGL
jgi:hypothetical protein